MIRGISLVSSGDPISSKGTYPPSPNAEMVRPSRAPPPLPCARLEPRRCFLSLCFFPRTQVWPKPPLCVSWVRRPRQDLERDASSTCSSQPLPACMRSLHHLRTCSGTVLRNLPSVQWFVSAQVLQHALTTAPSRLQPIPVPALTTPSPNNNPPPIHRIHSSDSTTLHLLAILSLFECIFSADARAPRSPQRAQLPSAPCLRYPFPLSLAAPTFLPLLS